MRNKDQILKDATIDISKEDPDLRRGAQAVKRQLEVLIDIRDILNDCLPYIDPAVRTKNPSW